MAQQTIFITGATGYIGRVVTELAIKDGYTVHGLSRSESGDALLTSLGATPIRGDLTTLDILTRESQSADMVFHLAFDHDFTKPYEQILAVDTAAVNALATPLVGTTKPLITTSGTSVVAAAPNGDETDESSPLALNPIIPRHLAESNALSWAGKGVRSISLRLPQYVYGRGTRTGFAALLLKLAIQSNESVYLGDGTYCTSSVYVDDAARLYLDAAAHGSAGDIFNGTGDTSTSYKALASAIGEAAGVPVRSMSVEEATSRWGPFLAGFLGIANRASNKRAVEELGWVPSGPGLLEEIQKGSYLGVVEEFRKANEAGKL